MSLRRLRLLRLWRRERQRRCPDYFPGCVVCEWFSFYDENGKFPTNGWTAPKPVCYAQPFERDTA